LDVRVAFLPPECLFGPRPLLFLFFSVPSIHLFPIMLVTSVTKASFLFAVQLLSTAGVSNIRSRSLPLSVLFFVGSGPSLCFVVSADKRWEWSQKLWFANVRCASLYPCRTQKWNFPSTFFFLVTSRRQFFFLCLAHQTIPWLPLFFFARRCRCQPSLRRHLVSSFF